MAHVTKLGGLTDELVTLLTSTSAKSNPARFNAHRESALRALRYHNYPRTNQFDVKNRFEGLEEKFRVYNEDPLADALKERIDILSTTDTKWTTEILHLLLELSDRPVANSRLEDLNFLKEPELDVGPPLNWKDLVAEDPLLRDKQVWRNVDFGAESSEEDGFEDSRSELSDMVTVQSSVDEDFYRHTETYVVETPNKEELKDLRNAQFWLKTPNIGGVKLETVKKPITELQAIREVLFMLSGLPTSLFVRLPERPMVVASKGYTLKYVSHDAFYKLLRSLASHGSAIIVLRSWTKRAQSIPLLQVLQSSILNRTMELDAALTMMQQRYVAPEGDVVISLLAIQAEVSFLIRPLAQLSNIIERLDAEPYAHAFRYLEMLYDATCIAQMAGDDEMYSFMGRIFFECFQIYLCPIRAWMEEGELSQGDKAFFISESESSGPSEQASVWQSRYKIRQTQDGILHTPRFLHAAATKIFTTGKSVVVLKYLNQFSFLQSAGKITERSLDFETVCKPQRFELAPFPELFDMAFESWIESKHHHASLTLRKFLFDSCGLHTALDALAHIYFMTEGTTAAVFTNSIFDKLDTLDNSWNDRFSLTELSQSTFGSLPHVWSDRLRTKILQLPRKYHDVSKCRRSVKALSVVEMRYQLSWPIQIILMPEAISSYQRIFTFLFQIRRSTHILSRQRLVKDILTHTSSSDERALYYSLRTRLLWFNQTLYHYLTSLVLEPRSWRVREDLKSSEDLDNMIEVHSTYIKLATDQALLGSKLKLIHNTILKVLDLGIKLEDAQAANTAVNKEAQERQLEMMGLSMASLGLHTPQRKGKSSQSALKSTSKRKQEPDLSSEDDEKEVDIDLSILSSNFDGADEEMLFVEKLRKMRGDFFTHVRFVIIGLKSVARAGGGEEARSWDILGDMLESGLETGVMRYS